MAGSRSALIIASYAYQSKRLGKLAAPPRDAKTLSDVLKARSIGGFQVQLLTNQPSHVVLRAIEGFLSFRDKEDMVLLYFSGHGVKDKDGRLYLATTDSDLDLLRSSAVATQFINDLMQESRSRRQLLILDCCYSGAFARGFTSKSDKEIDRSEFEGEGRIVLAASNAVQYSFEGSRVKGHATTSVFTRALVEGLKSGAADLNHDGQISVDELYAYARARLLEQEAPQSPRKWEFDFSGDFVIAQNPRARGVALPRQLKDMLSSSVVEVRGKAIEELSILSRGPDPVLSELAHKQLVELAKGEIETGPGRAPRGVAILRAEKTETRGPKRPRTSRDPRSVYLNVPLDAAGEPLMIAYIAALSALGLTPRSSIEVPVGGQSRLVRVLSLIGSCRYAFHDISRMAGTAGSSPGNAVLELGMSQAQEKSGHTLFVFDEKPYRVFRYLSDLSGVDVLVHGGTPDGVLREVANAMLLSRSRVPIQQLREVHQSLASSVSALKKKAHAQSIYTARLFNEVLVAARTIAGAAVGSQPK